MSSSHLVVIPSYNPGPLVYETVRGALAAWRPVWVVVDGSTDGTLEGLRDLEKREPGLRVLALPKNSGKGAAVRHAFAEARAAGFTHALTMDADGQHPAGHIESFLRLSQAHPQAMILGVPVFGEEAPAARTQGRKISNNIAHLETLGGGIGDSLFGFRVYPIAPTLAVLAESPGARRFDFDPETAVRLYWRGVPPLNVPAPVRYLRRDQGGVSHFNYLRDNALLTWMHTRLILGFLLRLPRLVALRRRPRLQPISVLPPDLDALNRPRPADDGAR